MHQRGWAPFWQVTDAKVLAVVLMIIKLKLSILGMFCPETENPVVKLQHFMFSGHDLTPAVCSVCMHCDFFSCKHTTQRNAICLTGQDMDADFLLL